MSSNDHRRLREQSLDFLRSGYLFTSRVRQRAGLPADSQTPVRLRLMGRKAVLLRGVEGVRHFYDSDKVKREGAMPAFVRLPLFGPGAVHGLDGDAHTVRKNALADLAYDDDRVAHFASLVAEELEHMLDEWSRHGSGTVYHDTTTAYGRAAFRWAGLPLRPEESNRRARQMSRLLDTFGRISGNPVAQVERLRLDRWATSLVRKVRSGAIYPDPDSVLAAMADLRDENGRLVDDRTAAVELQNLTRPTVAVARFAAFAAAALAENPAWRDRIREASADAGRLTEVPEAVAFAQEVRRVYPFVPMLPALATTDFEVRGCPVHEGQRVLLDLQGTDTDPNHWRDAGTFDPERFLGVDDAEQLEAFIPHGGAGVRSGHRCPGEKIAVTALSATVAALCRPGVRISDDTDDLTFPWTTMLTRPATGVRVRVHPTPA
ncbi:cytochrome [Dietzia natronolimnaea]|uniref:Cytochrome n=1 Tax=Dietzia natronolimnaea TaxID=161920 RepID=A0A2A2WS05_9ACTN|nr:cytochrome P450 [Dietzia natronolimnaea]PAY23992.1 cytochrome [Dietzia natronolimnaea]